VQTGRKTLVFIHGSGGDHTNWIQQYTPLKTTFNIAALDLPATAGPKDRASGRCPPTPGG